ncbi:unnamed protein product [Prorocentrum cordatum]|uniref:TIR domain-containing protein n=1 Tax=Prorocentrum cordatum TaxID=2364126 RepID=A0ABN9SQP1_9DINO|nr:unnamed protein product [Polarella glacialis]
MSSPTAARVPAVELTGEAGAPSAVRTPGASAEDAEDASPGSPHRKSVLRHATCEMLVELRGIALQSCLNGGGQIWDSSAGDLRYRGRAKVCRRLDYFVSHDWGTSRWVKLLTLAVDFNGTPAFCTSLAVSVVVFALQVQGVLVQRMPPQVRTTAGVEFEEASGVWCFPAGCCTFFFVLLYWQVFRERVLSPICVFVDKACINQVDPEEKRRGVYSIGGFLQKSDRLLMLCTSRYFSRMWCAFEVAAWLQYKDVGSIIFLPPSETLFTSVFFSIVLLTHAGVYVGTQFPGVPVVPCALVVLFVFPLPLVHSARLAMRALMSMPEELRVHDVTQTQCFCCSHQHVDPTTRAALICDRELVYDAIDFWYGGGRPRRSYQEAVAETSGPSPDVSVATGRVGTARFNEDVQTKLSHALEIMVAKPASYTSCLLAAAPSLWRYLDQVTAIVVDGPHDPYLILKRSVRIVIVSFLLWPLMRASVAAGARRFWRRGASRCGELGRTVVAFGIGYLPLVVSYVFAVTVAEPNEGMVFEAVLIFLLAVRLAFLVRPRGFVCRLCPGPGAT